MDQLYGVIIIMAQIRALGYSMYGPIFVNQFDVFANDFLCALMLAMHTRSHGRLDQVLNLLRPQRGSVD